MTKWVFAASAALMSYLLSGFGRSAEEPMGVLLIGPVAGALCFLSAGLYALYPERHIRAELKEKLGISEMKWRPP